MEPPPVARARQRHDARRHGRRRPAAAAARRAAQVPGVAAGPEQRRLGYAQQSKLGHVGFTQNVEARRLPAPHQLSIFGRHEVAQRPAAAGLRRARVGRPEVLEQKRHPAQRTHRQPGRRPRPRRLKQGEDDGVEARVHGFGAGDGGLG